MLLYRVALTVFAPVLIGIAIWRLIRGRTGLSDINQRLGGGAGHTGSIWVHGASNGELTSARPLIEALMAQNPQTQFVVTSNTTTGRDLVNGWQMHRLSAQLAPLDYRWILHRFRRRWQPILLVSLENEMWPNRIATLSCPVICIAARLSKRSADRWAFRPGVMQAMLANIAYLIPQDARSGDRFLDLGLAADRLGPATSLKPTVAMPVPSPAILAEFQNVFQRDRTILAASTHDGEDAILLDGFRVARDDQPGLKLILAPRHPHRASAIKELALQRNLTVATRSKGESPDQQTDVYLVDTLGEMPIWYNLASLTFVGGSLVERGGHTPFEPAAAGSMMVHGSCVENFEDAYKSLQSSGASIMVETSQDFAKLLCATTAEERTAFAIKAKECLNQLQGDPVALSELAKTLMTYLK